MNRELYLEHEIYQAHCYIIYLRNWLENVNTALENDDINQAHDIIKSLLKKEEVKLSVSTVTTNERKLPCGN